MSVNNLYVVKMTESDFSLQKKNNYFHRTDWFMWQESRIAYSLFGLSPMGARFFHVYARTMLHTFQILEAYSVYFGCFLNVLVAFVCLSGAHSSTVFWRQDVDSIPAEVRQVVALEIINAINGRRYLTATATETELVFSRYQWGAGDCQQAVTTRHPAVLCLRVDTADKTRPPSLVLTYWLW